jgi:outer membrane protein TolC
MVKLKRSIFVLLTFVFHSTLISQPKLTLDDCLKQAFEQSNLIKISEIDARHAEKKYAETKAQRLPQINLSGMYTRIGEVTSFSIPMGPNGESRTFQFGTQNRMNLDVKMEFAAFTWGRISGSIQMSESGIKISELQHRQQVLLTTDQVLRAFYSLLLNQEVIKLHQTNLQRAEKHYQVTKTRFESGYIPKLEYLRAQVKLKNSETSLEEATSNLTKSKLFLAKLIGRSDEEVEVTGAFERIPVAYSKTELTERALSARTDLHILQIRQNMTENEITIAGSSNKPNLFLFSGYNVQNGFDPMDPNRFIDNWNVGAQVVIPLFDGFATSNKVQQAKLNLQSAQLQEQEIRQMIRMQIQQTIITVEQSRDKIMNQEKNIELARETLKVAETQYQNGHISSLEVLDAQQMLSQAELLHTQAIFNNIMSKLDLCKSIEDYSWFGTELDVK